MDNIYESVKEYLSKAGEELKKANALEQEKIEEKAKKIEEDYNQKVKELNAQKAEFEQKKEEMQKAYNSFLSITGSMNTTEEKEEVKETSDEPKINAINEEEFYDFNKLNELGEENNLEEFSLNNPENSISVDDNKGLNIPNINEENINTLDEIDNDLASSMSVLKGLSDEAKETYVLPTPEELNKTEEVNTVNNNETIIENVEPQTPQMEEVNEVKEKNNQLDVSINSVHFSDETMAKLNKDSNIKSGKQMVAAVNNADVNRDLTAVLESGAISFLGAKEALNNSNTPDLLETSDLYGAQNRLANHLNAGVTITDLETGVLNTSDMKRAYVNNINNKPEEKTVESAPAPEQAVEQEPVQSQPEPVQQQPVQQQSVIENNNINNNPFAQDIENELNQELGQSAELEPTSLKRS